MAGIATQTTHWALGRGACDSNKGRRQDGVTVYRCRTVQAGARSGITLRKGGKILGKHRAKWAGLLFLPVPPCEDWKSIPSGPMPANLASHVVPLARRQSDLASTQPATRPLGTSQRTWRCGGFWDGGLAPGW